MRSILIVGSLLLSLAAAGPAVGQAAPSPAADAPPPRDPLGRETPRGTVLGFMRAADGENYERAVQYLDSRAAPAGAAELARKLKTILDRGLRATDLDWISSQPEGRLDDDLPPGVERVGAIRTEEGSVAILLERVQRTEPGPIWLVSGRTLARVPSLYAELELSWVERLMPPRWRSVRVLDVLLWRWVLFLLAVPLVLAAAWVLHRLLVYGLRPLLRRLTGADADAQLAKVAPPLRVLAGGLSLAIWATFTALPLLTRVFWTQMAAAVALVGVAWLVFRLADTGAEVAETRLRLLSQTGRLAVVQLLRRLTKITVVLVVALVLLYLAGLNLTAALAGVGIGGIAVAFAAQKTLENLFGGVMIISDQPIRVGDYCQVGDVSGTVEDIGLRSTRVRTIGRTVVSIPNGHLAAVSVENFGVRDKIVFRPTIGLTYDTSAEQLRYVLAEIRRMLYGHPMVETDSCRVRFVRFGASSLDLDIFAYVLTGDMPTFLAVQEDLLLRIMDVLEEGGAAIAFPTSTMRLTREGSLDAAKVQAATARVKRWREAGDLPFPNHRPERIAELRDTLDYPPADSALAHRPPGSTSA